MVDGVDGPEGPKKVERPDAVQRSESVDRHLAVDQVDGAAGAAGVATADQIVLEAIQGVKADIQTGTVGGADEVLEAVIDRIIEDRYPDVSSKDRQVLTANLFSVLKDDPVMGGLIERLLEEV